MRRSLRNKHFPDTALTVCNIFTFGSRKTLVTQIGLYSVTEYPEPSMLTQEIHCISLPHYLRTNLRKIFIVCEQNLLSPCRNCLFLYLSNFFKEFIRSSLVISCLVVWLMRLCPDKCAGKWRFAALFRDEIYVRRTAYTQDRSLRFIMQTTRFFVHRIRGYCCGREWYSYSWSQAQMHKVEGMASRHRAFRRSQ
jgi:hypothetical protein